MEKKVPQKPWGRTIPATNTKNTIKLAMCLVMCRPYIEPNLCV